MISYIFVAWVLHGGFNCVAMYTGGPGGSSGRGGRIRYTSARPAGQQRRFPILDFLGIPNKGIDHGLYQRMQSLLCNEQGYGKCCDCDEQCIKFKSCCMDKFWNTSNPVSMDVYKRLLIDNTKKYKNHKCEKIVPSAHHPKNGRYFMISTCPPGANADYSKKCLSRTGSSFRSLIPVVGEDRYLYRNSFCARCHSVHKFEYVSIKVSCYEESEVYGMVQKCIFTIDDNRFSNEIRSCAILTGTKECNAENKFHDLCNSYMGNMRDFANFHCRLCKLNLQTSTLPNYIDTCIVLPGFLPWSRLISFSDNAEVKNVKKENGRDVRFCHTGDINNIFRDKCLPIKCQKNYRRRGSTCVPISTPKPFIVHLRNPNFDKCMTANKPTLFIVYELTNTESVYGMKSVLSILNMTEDFVTLYHRDKDTVIYRVKGNISLQTENDIISQYGELKSQFLKNNISLMLSSTYTPLISKLHKLDFSNAFPQQKICYKPTLLDVNLINFTSNCDVYQYGRRFNFSDTSISISFDRNNITRYIAICDQFYMISNCSIKVLNTSITIDTNGSMTYNGWSNKTYSVEEYVPSKYGAAVCMPNVLTVPVKVAKVSSIEVIDLYLSWIGTSISIVCYLIIILTFCAFKQLRNVPGLCTLALTSSLLIGDGMYLLAGILDGTGHSKIYALCKTVAMLLHFGLIMAYAWSIIIAYDLMISFTSFNVVSGSGNSKFKYYVLVTVLSSLVIIVLTFILDQLRVVRIGYGDDGTCIPHKFYGRLYFYIIPAVVSFIISIVLLTVTICKISQDNKRNKKALKNSGRKDMNVTLLALKLILVLGISEGIGFIHIRKTNLSESEAQFNNILGLLYTLARSMRGVLLVIVYICRKEILQLHRKLIGRCVGEDKRNLVSSRSETNNSSFSTTAETRQ